MDSSIARATSYQQTPNSNRNCPALTSNTGVPVQRDLALVQHIVERRPAAARIVLCLRAEQVLVAHDALVHARLVELVVNACARA